MAEYKNIPVDLETYERLGKVAAAYGRKLGAQVKAFVDAEYARLESGKLLFAHMPNEGRMEAAEQAIRAFMEKSDGE